MTNSQREQPITKNHVVDLWFWFGLIGVLIVAAASAVLIFLQPDGVPFCIDPTLCISCSRMALKQRLLETGTLNYAEVVVTDLRQEEAFNGKLESIKGTGTVIAPMQWTSPFPRPAQ